MELKNKVPCKVCENLTNNAIWDTEVVNIVPICRECYRKTKYLDYVKARDKK
jgi:hypothetical protein